MQKENSISLFLPLLTGILLLFVFLSGITEIACLASYASKPDPASLTNKTRPMAPTVKNAPKMLSSVVVTDLSK